MEIKILKDCKWSFNGRIASYFAGQIVVVDSKNGESMIKHEYAEKCAEVKMMHTELDDKMMHFELEDKSIRPARKNRKSKEIENE